MKARSLNEDGKFLEASNLLRQGVRQAPWATELQIGLVMTLGFAKEWGEVGQEYRKLNIASGISTEATIMCAKALRNLGKPEECLHLLEKVTNDQWLNAREAMEITSELSRLLPLLNNHSRILKVGSTISFVALETLCRHLSLGFVLSSLSAHNKFTLYFIMG